VPGVVRICPNPTPVYMFLLCFILFHCKYVDLLLLLNIFGFYYLFLFDLQFYCDESRGWTVGLKECNAANKSLEEECVSLRDKLIF
jgi:hypothetical protein